MHDLSPSDISVSLKLPSIISDHMVLAKSRNVPIWGKADPGEKITVTLNRQIVITQADSGGKWRIELNLENSGSGPFEMIVKGKSRLVVSDVLVGEVWVASGQSNMGRILRGTFNPEKEIDQSSNLLLREFKVKETARMVPMEDCIGEWKIAGPDTSGEFSGTGYYFGKFLQENLQVPIGMIHASWGGTPVEAWTSSQSLERIPDLNDSKERDLKLWKDYLDQKSKFVTEFSAWLEANDRQERSANAEAFAGLGISTEDWIHIMLPGTVSGPGLPENGAIWLRKEIELPERFKNFSLRVELGEIKGFDSLYWNGEWVAETTYKSHFATGPRSRIYEVPWKMVKEGMNVLAIRIFAPVTRANFPVVPRITKPVEFSLGSAWQAKAEYEMPPLQAKAIAGVPWHPPSPPNPPFQPSFLFNGMISPILPYAIQGVIWYQGESNALRAYQYRTSFPLLIKDWREHWGRGDLPFYYCQLANYRTKQSEPSDGTWAELREAQSLALKLPNTGQAVLIDVGESEDIHPLNKRDPGTRLARIALAHHYEKNIPFSGPVYDSMKIEDNKIRLIFKYADEGLVAKKMSLTYDVKRETGETALIVRNSPNSDLEGFAICGEDRKWVWADARIDGDAVIVWSNKVPSPIAVRYAWADNPTCNLYNGVGLPASPFRTDDFPLITKEIKY